MLGSTTTAVRDDYGNDGSLRCGADETTAARDDYGNISWRSLPSWQDRRDDGSLPRGYDNLQVQRNALTTRVHFTAPAFVAGSSARVYNFSMPAFVAFCDGFPDSTFITTHSNQAVT